MSKLKRVKHGWDPEDLSITEAMEWAMLARYPARTSKDCKEIHGPGCKPQKSKVTIIFERTELEQEKDDAD